MYFTTTLLLPLAVTAGVIEERQFKGFGDLAGLRAKFGNPANVAGVEILKPQIRTTAQRTITKLGPFNLTGASTGAGGVDSTLRGNSFFQSIKNGFCNEQGPCTVLAGQVGVQFADGSKADPSTGIYIHHIITADFTKKQTPWLSNCGEPNTPGFSITAMGGTGFVGTGEDSADGHTLYTSTDGTRDSGFHVNKGDTFLMNAQLVNYNKEPKQVFITYDLEWVPGVQGEDMKNSLISVTQCGPKIKLSTTGPTNTTSRHFYIMENGRIVRSKGHLHDGGVSVDLFINDKHVCSSKPTYGTRGQGGEGMSGHSHGGSEGGVAAEATIKTISAISSCEEAIPVKKGDALSMNVQYDLKRYPLRKSAGGHEADVMGMWSLTFAADH